MAKATVTKREIKITLELELAEAQGLLSLFNHIAGGVVDKNNLGEIYSQLNSLTDINVDVPLKNIDPKRSHIGWLT